MPTYNDVPSDQTATEVGIELRGTVEAHSVLIDRVMNGYYVKVGCKRLVFETREKLLSELERYLKNPKDVTKEYLEKYKE